MGFSRQERWNGLPCPPPKDLPCPRIKHRDAYVSCIGRQVLYHKRRAREHLNPSSTQSSEGLFININNFPHIQWKLVKRQNLCPESHHTNSHVSHETSNLILLKQHNCSSKLFPILSFMTRLKSMDFYFQGKKYFQKRF